MNTTGQQVILIKIVIEGKETRISTFKNEYRSLMTLISDRLYTDGFGECGGMGRCATCQVRMDNKLEIADMERNESSTLARLGIVDSSIRLSCQVLIDAALHNVTVWVLP